MEKKIIAIGGGENGRKKSDGTFAPYETEKFDKEIIRLSGKEKPNVLFLAHAQWIDEREDGYIETMRKIYEERFDCGYRFLKKEDLKSDWKKVEEYINWADVIYEGGGDTVAMIKSWQETGFDKLIKQSWESGKVMCGISAGAICWFTYGHTLNPEYKEKIPNKINGLGFIDAYFSPHSNYDGKYESIKQSLKFIDKAGILLSNCCALEIIDDKFRVLKTDASNYNIESFCLKTYWKDDKYIELNLEESLDFSNLNKLINKERA